MSENPPPTRRRSPLRPVFAIAAVAAAGLCAAVLGWPRQAEGPVATFHFGPDRATVQPFDQVPTFDEMTLQLDLPEGGFVYLVTFDYGRGAVCYYPTEFLGTDHLRADGRMNELKPGRHELPGTWDDKPQAWFVPDAEGALSLCVIVSPRAIEDLESTLKLTRQVGNRAFRTRTMGHYMPRAGRDKVVGAKRMPHPILAAAQNQMSAMLPGPMVPLDGFPEVLVTTMNIRPTTPRPGAKPPENPFATQIEAQAKAQGETRQPESKASETKPR